MSTEQPPLPNEPIPQAELVEDAPIERIPLTISYFFVWMMSASVLIRFVYLNYLEMIGQRVREQRTMYLALYFINGLLVSATLATWIFVIKKWWVRVPPFPRLAGHWICLLFPLSNLVQMGLFYLSEWLEWNHGLEYFSGIWFLLYAAQQFSLAIIWTIPLCLSPRSSNWRFPFFVNVILSLMGSLFLGGIGLVCLSRGNFQSPYDAYRSFKFGIT